MAFGGGLDDTDDVVSEINMTPLVDVMLVLLIIFIITVPVITHSVNIDLPEENNVPNEVKPDTVQLSINAAGELHWNESVIMMPELETRLVDIAQKQPQPEIHIRGDRAVAYEHVIKVMGTVQRAGLRKIGFVTEPNI